MNPDLNKVLDAAMKLPLNQQRELIAKLEHRNEDISKEKVGNVRKYFGIFDSGDPRSADNDKIDADLEREYVNDHAPEN